jgi:hypothetical protein
LKYDVLPTDVLCYLIGLPEGRLLKWASDGYVKPYKPGRTRKPHRFSVRQCIALGIIAALSDSPRHDGVTAGYIRKTVAFFQRITDSQLMSWMQEGQGDSTPHTAESFASIDFAGFKLAHAEAPGDRELKADIKQRLGRLESLLLGRPMPKHPITRIPDMPKLPEAEAYEVR